MNLKTIVASFFSFILLTSCAQIGDGLNSLNSSCTEAKTEYNRIKPRLDRNFKILFGTNKNGDIDTGVQSANPGVQDIVFARFDTFNADRKARLKFANVKSKQLYSEYQSLTQRIEEKGPSVCESIQEVNALMQQKQMTGHGISVLKDFVKIAGEAYLSK